MKIYAYGVTIWSSIHKLKEGYPKEDTYGEIIDSHQVPGGEAANCALILDKWGHHVSLDGCKLGTETKELITDFFGKTGIDISPLSYDSNFEGWKDIVLCAGNSRTVFGWFGRHYSSDIPRWTQPSFQKIKEADCVVLDPSFPGITEEIAQYCVETNTDYITVDTHKDNAVAQNARVVICSNEFLSREYPNSDPRALLNEYTTACDGLVIFTFGAKEILYASKTQDIATFTPYTIEVTDTLAAGDSFRAGVTHAVLEKMSDKEIVAYGAATAGAVCQRFPSIHPIPTLEEIQSIQS